MKKALGMFGLGAACIGLGYFLGKKVSDVENFYLEDDDSFDFDEDDLFEGWDSKSEMIQELLDSSNDYTYETLAQLSNEELIRLYDDFKGVTEP